MPSLDAQAAMVGSLIGFAKANWTGYRAAPHHRLIADSLRRVARGECKRLCIFMPPRHGKSMLASEFFPAWFLGRNPEAQIIAATYAQGLADDFGRKVRNIVAGEVFAMAFPGVAISDDSQAANRFHTSKRGAYFAVGAGGPITGRGADLLLIDDPIKGREDAESETMRNRLKDWYTSVARTRLMPGGNIVVIQCMTGDTPVLMGDGLEKPLRDIKIGDCVATLSGDELAVSTVLNHASQGVDSVYEMRMASGTVVRANARHPFLVECEGGWRWLKIGEIVEGDKVRRVIGESGRVKPAQPKVVNSLHGVAVCATFTTNAPNGQADIGHHLPLIQIKREIENSGIGMVSEQPNTTSCWLSRAGFAQFASGPTKRDLQNIGTLSQLTTATKRDGYEGYFATNATSLLEGVGVSKSYSAPLSTFVLTVDTVEEIRLCGHEEVFDIQVEGTENFVANGLISHNTRWHEDDLAGWLLREHAHENWEVLNLPALAEPGDPLGRPEGAPLWPDAYPLSELETLRRSVGSRDWASLYQQRPAAAEGSIFKRQHWQFFMPTEHNPSALVESLGIYRVVQAWDTAFKTKEANDFSVCCTIGVAKSRFYVLDVWRDRVEFPDLKRALVAQAQKWGAHAVLVEDTAAGQSLLQELRRNTRVPLIPVKADRDKVTRSHAVTALHEAGLVYLPDGEHWVSDFTDELASFPNAPHDDQVDAFVHALTYSRSGASAPRVIEDDDYATPGGGWMAG